MLWSTKRKLMFALGAFGILLILAVGIYFLFIYRSPTCFDGIMNQDETGIDCDGTCLRLCVAPRVSAVWSRAVLAAPGVYHAVALVRNPESKAGTMRLPYSFSLFDSKNILIATRNGIMKLEPGEIAPLFEPNIITSERIPARTFVELGRAEWLRSERSSIPIRISSQAFDEQSLRLDASIENTIATEVKNIVITALLYDADELLVSASQTNIDTLKARATRDISFTWQVPFEKPVVRSDILIRIK